MIRDTKADCKILSMATVGTIAKVVCVIFSTKAAEETKAFQFYFKDTNGQLTLLSNKVYWIDRTNAYNTSLVNVNVLNYKEIQLDIDITNSSNSIIVDKHWVRKGNIVLINTDDASMSSSWSSQEVTLISDNFEIPSLKYAAIHSSVDSNNTDKMFLNVKFKLSFTSSQTLSYNCNNLIANVKLRNISGQKLLETITIEGRDLSLANEVKFNESYLKDMPLILEIEITNQQGVPYFTYKKRYTPRKTTGKTFIRTSSGIKTAIGWYRKSEIHDDFDKGEWLDEVTNG